MKSVLRMGEGYVPLLGPQGHQYPTICLCCYVISIMLGRINLILLLRHGYHGSSMVGLQASGIPWAGLIVNGFIII